MNQRQLWKLSQHWTPEQILAVYDFCSLMSESLWQQHQEVLLAYMMKRDRDAGHESPCPHKQGNLELPFDDPIPF